MSIARRSKCKYHVPSAIVTVRIHTWNYTETYVSSCSIKRRTDILNHWSNTCQINTLVVSKCNTWLPDWNANGCVGSILFETHSRICWRCKRESLNTLSTLGTHLFLWRNKVESPHYGLAMDLQLVHRDCHIRLYIQKHDGAFKLQRKGLHKIWSIAVQKWIRLGGKWFDAHDCYLIHVCGADIGQQSRY